jgi:hypothetical protein
MPVKLVRFARVKTPHSHYAGHYSFPCIEEGDTVLFVSRYVRIVLTFEQSAQSRFVEHPSSLEITPYLGGQLSGQTLIAACPVDLEGEFRKSTIRVTSAQDEQESGNHRPLNYGYYAMIDPCEP